MNKNAALILLSLLTFIPCLAPAQTADDWITTGRNDLSAHDIVGANNAFALAVNLSPTNETANALYAVTRLLTLPSQPAISNFLTRLGFSVNGRDIYNWTSVLSTNAGGAPLIPAGVNGDEFTGQLRTNVLPQIAGAIGNLSAITHTNFILNLSSSETAAYAVAVDYGDCKLIQAGLCGAQYLIYTLNSQNLDFQLTAIYDLYTNNTLSIERLLNNFPQLLTTATTNDLQSARAAFANAVNTYLLASEFIRARSTNDVRLFNFDVSMANDEANFRATLQDLETSLVSGPQSLSVNPSLTADMSPQFDGSLVLRDLFPKFRGNAILLGSFPDLTFDQSIDGLSQGSVEGFFGSKVTMIPVAQAPKVVSANTLGVTFNTLQNHYYALEASTNLVDWQMITNFTARDVTSTLLDSMKPAKQGQFYRLRDDTGYLTFSGVVVDYATSQPVAGAQIYSEWDGTGTTTDANGQFYLRTTLEASPKWWNSDQLQVSASGYATSYPYYWGDGLVSGLVISLSP